MADGASLDASLRWHDSKLKVRFLGTQVPYHNGMEEMRKAMRDIDLVGPQLLLLEHEDIITVTRQHGRKHLLTSDDDLRRDNIKIIETDRGGDITFHGRGQLVGYPILKLAPSQGPLDYVRTLEGILLRVCARLGVTNTLCLPGKTGIWIQDDSTGRAKKLVAIGVGISRGVTRHGFALNVRTDLERFLRHIVPCGLADYGVTSLERELPMVPEFEKMYHIIASEFSEVFDTACKKIKSEE